MKTAIQEMIQSINDIESKTIDQEQIYMLTALEIAALILLEKEKEQILAAYNNGSQDMALRDEYNPAEYYNQTYNQNK